VLTARRRRVREDVRAKKERLNPRGAQRRDFGKSNGELGRADQRRMSSVIVIAGGDHRRRAIVLNTTRILVDALMQLRGSTQRECPKERYGNERRDKRARATICTRERAHCDAIL